MEAHGKLINLPIRSCPAAYSLIDLLPLRRGSRLARFLLATNARSVLTRTIGLCNSSAWVAIGRISDMAKASNHRSRGATSVDAHIGQKIRTRRNLLGLSQTELADAAGITFQQIQKYEKGVNRVGAGRLQQFSDALGVPPSYFFEGAPTVGKKATCAAGRRTTEGLNRFISRNPRRRRSCASIHGDQTKSNSSERHCPS